LKTLLKALGWGLLALLLLVAALFGAAYFFPAWFQRPQIVKEAPVPSGRIYKLMGKGPLFFTQGGKALALNYRTDSFDDKSRIALEANELMTLIDHEAASAGYTGIVIMAHGPARPARFGTIDSSFNTVFQREPDGDWEALVSSKTDETPASADVQAADQKVVTDAYSRVVEGAKTRDLRSEHELEAPEYWHQLPDGRTLTKARDQEIEAKTLDALTTLDSMDVSLVRFIDRGSLAIAVVRQTSVGAIKDPSGRVRKFRDDKLCRDTWIKTASGWEIVLSEDLSDQFSFLD
jgi:hypothetical protein